MAYRFSFVSESGEKLLFPVAPQKMETRVRNQVRTLNCIDGTEIQFPLARGLREFRFEVLLPARKYPFARYGNDGFQTPGNLLKKLEKLQRAAEPFTFVITRKSASGLKLFSTKVKVCLEEILVGESAEHGSDLLVSIALKEFRVFETKKVKNGGVQKPTRPIDKKKKDTTYTVVSGDCLWNIAKKKLGAGSRWKEIFELNRDKIKNANLIYPGQVLKLPG